MPDAGLVSSDPIGRPEGTAKRGRFASVDRTLISIIGAGSGIVPVCNTGRDAGGATKR